MTCVVGIYSDFVQAIAGDTRVSGGGSYVDGQEKVWKPFPGVVLGLAGDWNVCQHLRFSFNWKGIQKNTHKWLVNKFVPGLRGMVQSLQQKEGVSISLLVLTKEGLFAVENDTVSCIPNGKYYGIGSGAPYAIGYLVNDAEETPDFEGAIWIAADYDNCTGKDAKVVRL